MKYLLVILACVLVYLGVHHYLPGKPQETAHTKQPPALIQLAILQDVSGSIRDAGIELVSSQDFAPFFSCTDRDLQISFVCISAQSAKRPISLYLHAKEFVAPQSPVLENLTITERRHTKDQYNNELKQYILDSTAYTGERDAAISLFCAQIDSLMGLYHRHLTRETDLVTAIELSDNTFTYSPRPAAKRFLIANTDGLDSHHRTAHMLHSKPQVLLVNATGIARTNIDSIIDKRFTDIHQAFLYSLQ